MVAVDRRDFMLGLAAAGYALVEGGAVAAPAADPTLVEQPWAVWSDSEKPVRGGYWRTAVIQYIGMMNPNHWPVLDWISMSYIHETLLYTDGSYRSTVPWLASGITFESPTSAVTKLREGVAFHDGTPFNAAAVKFVIDWIRDPKSGTWDASWLAPLDTVDVVDEHTLRWKFKTPWASFAGVISSTPGYMLSPTALGADAKKYDSSPVGTGSYMLEDASPGNFLKLKRNPNWWFAKASGHPDMPYFDGILVTVIPDPAVRLANLRAGALDILVIDKSQYATVKSDPNLNVYVLPFNTVNALRFNCTKGVCSDIRVRRAISHALDRRALIAGTQFGLARIASCAYPEDHWAHNPDLRPIAYDPELAKKLLAEAGHAGGLTVRGYYNNTTQGQTIAEAVKNMLAKVGVTWDVELLAPVAEAGRRKDLDYDLAEGGWTWIFDPDLLATGLYMPDGGFNQGRSHNEAAIKLIEAGRAEIDLEKRRKIYWQLEKVLYDSYEDAWLWWEQSVLAMRKSVRGYDVDRIAEHGGGWFWSHPLWFKDGKPDTA